MSRVPNHWLQYIPRHPTGYRRETPAHGISCRAAKGLSYSSAINIPRSWEWAKHLPQSYLSIACLPVQKYGLTPHYPNRISQFPRSFITKTAAKEPKPTTQDLTWMLNNIITPNSTIHNLNKGSFHCDWSGICTQAWKWLSCLYFVICISCSCHRFNRVLTCCILYFRNPVRLGVWNRFLLFGGSN